MEARAAIIFLMLVTECLVGVMACGPGRGSGRPPRRRKMTPLVFKQHVPNVSENTLGASGPAEGSISRSEERFDDLVVNNNPDIVFKNRRGTNNDRIMSQRCKEKLNMLSVLVMNQWPDVRLRVTEGWVDDDAAVLGGQSLHLEGRAVDVTTSDRDRSKYGMLARLAVDAGFDWVYFESRGHIHCSVKSDSSMAAGSGGCFPGDALVTLQTGQTKTMDNLTVGDRVMTYDIVTKQFHYDAVVTFLHRSRQAPSTTRYLTVETQYGHHLSLTPGHLIFAAQHSLDDLQPIFAGELRPGSYVSVSTPDRRSVENKTKVVRVSWSRDKAGVYAPITERGTIVVDDVIVSCYAEFSSHVTAHASVAPLRYAFYLNEVTSGWLSDWFLMSQSSDDDDEVHWYALLLWRLAKLLVPRDLWWTTGHS